MLQDKTKEIRRILKISQRELSIIIGSTQTEISFVERGFIPTNEHKIKAIESLYEKAANV